MGVGMSIDMGVVTARLGLIIAAAIVITLLKAARPPSRQWAKTGLPRCKKDQQDLNLKARHAASTSIGYR